MLVPAAEHLRTCFERSGMCENSLFVHVSAGWVVTVPGRVNNSKVGYGYRLCSFSFTQWEYPALLMVLIGGYEGEKKKKYNLIFNIMAKKCFLGLKHVWVFIATNVFFRKMFNRHAD